MPRQADPRRVREQIESELLGQWRRLSIRQRREAIKLVGDPPDLSRIPEAQWEKWRQEEEALLFIVLYSTFASRSLMLGRQLEQAQQDARAFASTQAFLKSQQLAITRRERASTASVDPSDIDAQQRAIDTSFGTDRAEGILETESATGMVAGAEFTMDVLGLKSELDRWRTNPSRSKSGPCKVCQGLNGTPRRHWEAFFVNGPPAHPRCVCDVQYENQIGRG